ncbi:hypothetical protein KCP75_04770 [Salmonella enterica subsp. enterica]|nr:hypothetical protein KCP75_04770 [Salmonella enterica subsp. enterica]
MICATPAATPTFFDHAVAIEQRGNPTQIQLVWFGWDETTEDHPGVGGVVGNGVYGATLGFRVDVVAAGVNQFRQRRESHNPWRCGDVEQRAVGRAAVSPARNASSTSIRGTIKRSV